jgi:hypothetical protein
LFLSVKGQELLIIHILTDDRLPNRHLHSLINSFHGYIAFELDASRSKTNVTLHCVIWRSLLANIELSDRRIVVRNLLGLGHPGVDVNMLVLCLWLECLADKHMVKLLAVHIKEVSVSLELRNVCSFVEIP